MLDTHFNSIAGSGRLDGRVAMVTGASRGIGRAIARRLAAHGAAVAVTASPRSQAELDETCALIQRDGGNAVPLIADLALEDMRADLVAQVATALAPVDILVNNAATITAYAPPSKIDLSARLSMFEINFQAPVDLIQQALPGMRARGWGRIVNISSEMANQPPIPYPGPAKFVHALALYGTSKAALERYTVGLAAELHGSGVHANVMAPHKIARSEGAEIVAQQALIANPDWVEPLEMMAEAAYLLIAGSITGMITSSRGVLQHTQGALHALDGRKVIGNALSLMES